MTALEFGVMFSLGLVSSLHCAQMCGPIVLSYSVALNGSAKSGSRISPLLVNHLAYNFGRVTTYSVLGAIAGLVGETVGLLGNLAGWATTLALVSGTLMVLVGVVMLGVVPASLLGNKLFRVPARFLRPLGVLLSSQNAMKRFLLGLTLGFLPCGLIYAALLKAMATGSAIAGSLTMLAFGLGTTGALLAIGFFSSMIRGHVTRWGSQFAAASVTVMGILIVWRGMMAMGGHMHGSH